MSLRSLFKRYLPERHAVQKHKHLRFFGDLLHDPNIWHLTRRSSAGGVAAGLFCGFIPVPGQTIIAAAVAIIFRINLPLSVIFVWVTNPVTFAPIFFFAYKLGTWLLGERLRQVTFEFTWQWFTDKLIYIWEPLLLGCFILGSLSAAAGYIAVRLIWRLSLVRKWEDRRNRQKTSKTSNN